MVFSELITQKEKRKRGEAEGEEAWKGMDSDTACQIHYCTLKSFFTLKWLTELFRKGCVPCDGKSICIVINMGLGTFQRQNSSFSYTRHVPKTQTNVFLTSSQPTVELPTVQTGVVEAFVTFSRAIYQRENEIDIGITPVQFIRIHQETQVLLLLLLLSKTHNHCTSQMGTNI